MVPKLVKHFDLIVLGAGSGGLAAAKRAANYGASVAIVEGDRIGGTCVIRGCVPKKLLVYGSHYREHIDFSNSYGFDFPNVNFDSSLLLANVRKEVDRLNTLHTDLLLKSGVEIFSGWGSFVDKNTISVTRDRSSDKSQILINADRILIAAGGVPSLPDIPGIDLALNSDDMFLLKELPNQLIIVGGGYIACEFSCILNALGVKVLQLVRGKNLLNGFDCEIVQTLESDMSEKGIDIRFSKEPVSISGNYGDILLKTKVGEQFHTEGVLFATGRKPCLDRLNLGCVGVLVANGAIKVDSNQSTNIKNIFAVGDITDRINLTPVAVDQGRAFADTFYGSKPRKVNFECISSAVFSTPEIASVGFSEEKAIEVYGKDMIKVHKTKFRALSRNLPDDKSKCLLKLIVYSKNSKIIGCHMLGDNAAEIIQMAAISLKMGATKLDFDNTMALHPTISEEFVTMT